MSANGNLTKILEDLEYCGFIRRYCHLGNTSHRSIYQLIDSYTLFYYAYIKTNKHRDRQFWSKNLGTPQHNTWCGLAFERVCLLHVDQIKHALRIGGIMSSEFCWRSSKEKKAGDNKSEKEKQEKKTRGAQIDLLIDRSDDVIDITTYGLIQNEYSDIVQSVVKMDDLF